MKEDRLAIERTSKVVVDSMVKVHSALGPGLLESIYQTCLEHEIKKRGLDVQTEVFVPIHYDGIEIDKGLRADMIINDSVMVENKAVQALLPVHKTQLFTYLKLSGLRLGLLANWNCSLMKDGITRVVNRL
ncbi:MAG: GxxExxY protein [Wenzhouxiangella sp.]|jgi:GxxExxY protein|nr:GxxExxY protein [Wenzhouxiangella sp.]